MNLPKIFEALGDVGPAMGMIGTLIGLVQMAAMEDPSAIITDGVRFTTLYVQCW